MSTTREPLVVCGSPRKRERSMIGTGTTQGYAIFDGKEYECPPGYRLSISRTHKTIGSGGVVQEYIQNVKQTGYRCPEHCKFVPIRKKKPKKIKVEKEEEEEEEGETTW